MGRGWEWGGNASHTVDPWTWKLGGRELFLLDKRVPLALEPTAEQNEWFSPCPPSGEGVALSSPSPEIKQAPTSPGCLCQGRFNRLSGRYRGQLEHRGHHAPAWGSTRRLMIQHGAEPLLTCSLTLEGTGGRPRRQADWVLLCGGAEHHAGARCVASVCFCTAENCWAQSSTVSPKRHALEMRVSRKLTLSTSLLSTRQSHWWCSWTTPVDIAFPRTALRLFPPVGRGQLLSAVPASTSGWYYPRAFNALAWCACRIALACSAEAAWPAALQALAAESGRSLQALDGRRGQFLQVAAFCRHKCTATALSTWEMSTYPVAALPSRGSEDGGGRRAASGRKKGPSTTSSAPRALPGRKEPGQGVVASHGPCRGANHLTARARD